MKYYRGIPGNITEQHVLDAIREIDRDGQVRPGRESHKYDLLYKSKGYPPKYVISLANKYANGRELEPNKSDGRIQFDATAARLYLTKRLGFTVEPKIKKSKNKDD